MHHPLRALALTNDGRPEETDDELSETQSIQFSESNVGDDDRSTETAVRQSRLSLDTNQSLYDLSMAIKSIPLRHVNKPEFPLELKMFLIQEIRVDFPVFRISCSLDGQYLAVGGGNGDDGSGGGQLRVYPLISDKTSPFEGQRSWSPRTFILFEPTEAINMRKRTGAILDVAWCNGNTGFLFTAGMDKMASLWHISNANVPLMLFPHPDVVSSIAIHPKDDRLLLTGCIDGRLRLWSVEKAKVLTSTDLPHPITAVCFTLTGHTVVAGTATGHLFIYRFDDLGLFKYHSQIHVRSKRGKNAAGTAKVSGLQSSNGVNGDPVILVTTNDSRIRLYRLRDRECKVKFHGILNEDSQLQAVMQRDIVCCASEDGRVSLWRLPDMSKSLLLTLSEKLRGRILVDSLVTFRAALGKATDSEEHLQPSQPLSTATILSEAIHDILVVAGMRPPTVKSQTLRPMYIVTGDMTGRVKIFEWGITDLESLAQNNKNYN